MSHRHLKHSTFEAEGRLSPQQLLLPCSIFFQIQGDTATPFFFMLRPQGLESSLTPLFLHIDSTFKIHAEYDYSSSSTTLSACSVAIASKVAPLPHPTSLCPLSTREIAYQCTPHEIARLYSTACPPMAFRLPYKSNVLTGAHPESMHTHPNYFSNLTPHHLAAFSHSCYTSLFTVIWMPEHAPTSGLPWLFFLQPTALIFRWFSPLSTPLFKPSSQSGFPWSLDPKYLPSSTLLSCLPTLQIIP